VKYEKNRRDKWLALDVELGRRSMGNRERRTEKLGASGALSGKILDDLLSGLGGEGRV